MLTESPGRGTIPKSSGSHVFAGRNAVAEFEADSSSDLSQMR